MEWMIKTSQRKKMGDKGLSLIARKFSALWLEVGTALGLDVDANHVMVREFLRALSVKDLDAPGGLPPKLDAVWHAVIINTRDYAALCHELRGQFIHHTTISARDDHIERQSRIDHTIHAYRKRYREEPLAEWWETETDELKDEGRDNGYQIFVKNLNGKALTFRIPNRPTMVYWLMLAIQDKIGVCATEQRLIFAGKQLMPNKWLREDYGVNPDVTIHLVLGVSGC